MVFMEAITLPTTIAALLVLIIVTFVIRKLSDKKRYYPIAGTVFNLVLNFNRAHDYMTDLSRKNKTYRILAGPFRSQIFTADPIVVEHILKSNFPNYGKGGYFHSVMEDMMGDGILNVDGEKWKQQRTAFTHEFSTKNLRDFTMGVFRRNATRFHEIISEAASTNSSVDMQEILLRGTLECMVEVGFGVELDSIGVKEAAQFATSFNEVSGLILLRYIDVFWKIKRFFNVGFEAKLNKNIKVVDDFIHKLIRAKVERASHPDRDSSKKKDDLLSRFLELSDTNPKYLKDIISNFLQAGRDPNAAALSWLMYRMCIHPEMQEKVVQEVKDAVQLEDNASISEFLAKATDNRVLDKMQYLTAVISESLRIHPPLPLNAKCCFSDDTLPDGFSVKKGDLIAYQPYVMGRMKFLWGEDAEEFRPERWLDQDGRCRIESPFKFTAFQAGPRICAGKEFTYTQMKVFTAAMLHFFVFELEDKTKPVNYKIMLNLNIDGGLKLRASPRVCRNY